MSKDIIKDAILITGGAGFIGSHLAEYILAQKISYEILVLDNYSTGTIENHIDGINYIKGDTKNISELIPKGYKIKEIYHLGEYSRVEQSFDEIEKVWKYNSSGTFEVLQYSLKHNCKLLYAGSSTKFGDGGLGRNQSPYGWIKSSNTDLVKNYGDWFGLNYVIVYFYNGYGPREISEGKYATLIAKFLHKMKKNEDLTVVLPGVQKRNFTHVSDLVKGIYLAQQFGSGDGYGIGADESYTIEDVAKMFGGNIVYLPERKGNRINAEVHNSKIKDLGWEQEHYLEDYVQKLKEKNWFI